MLRTQCWGLLEHSKIKANAVSSEQIIPLLAYAKLQTTFVEEWRRKVGATTEETPMLVLFAIEHVILVQVVLYIAVNACDILRSPLGEAS